MKRTYKQLKARFKPETRFEVRDLAPVPHRGELEKKLEQLKARLLKPVIRTAANPAYEVPLRLAANEAAGLAWFTPFPLLFFPALFEEKITAAQRQQARQREILEQTEGFIQTVVE